MSQETSIIINHNGFLVWGPKGPKNKNKNNKNNNFTLSMTMPQAAGKKHHVVCWKRGERDLYVRGETAPVHNVQNLPLKTL